jgi:hypothetical protein
MVAAAIRAGQARAAAAGAVAAAVAVALYCVTVSYGFVFDDLSLIGADGPRALGNGTVPYRPLRYLSYGLDHRLGAGAAWAYHATNVTLHAAGSALVVAVALRLGARRAAATCAGVFFAVHPLGVEAVAYIAGRRDLLSTVCMLAALAAWTSPAGRSAWAVLAAIGAVAAKESGALVVPVLALASASGLGPPLSRAGVALAATALVAVTLPVAYGAIGPVAPQGPFCAVVGSAARMASHYALHTVAPVGLSIEYPSLALASASCSSMLGPSVLAGFVLLGIACGVLVATLRVGVGASGRASAVRFAWSWTALWLVAIATVLGVHEPGADRHAYPMLGALGVAAALTISSMLDRSARAGDAARSLRMRTASTAVVAYLAMLAVLTAQRLPAWRDERALWTATVASTPTSGRAHHNLAGVLLASGAYREAAAHVRAARALDYAPALLGDAAIACARGFRERGRTLLARAAARGLPPADIARIAPSCE